MYTWPLDAVTVTEAESRALTAATIRGDAGVGCFLSPMLATLASASTTVSPLTSARLASEVAELAITAAWEVGHRDACDQPDSELLRRIQVFTEQNLADPELAPARIACEFFMSPRTLHRLFARHGLTVAGWIKRRRLEACRRALGSPAVQHLGISEIARRYGFPNPSFFSREFTLRYGESPGPDTGIGCPPYPASGVLAGHPCTARSGDGFQLSERKVVLPGIDRCDRADGVPSRG